MSPENVMEITQRVAKIELTLVVFIDVKILLNFCGQNLVYSSVSEVCWKAQRKNVSIKVLLYL